MFVLGLTWFAENVPSKVFPAPLLFLLDLTNAFQGLILLLVTASDAGTLRWLRRVWRDRGGVAGICCPGKRRRRRRRPEDSLNSAELPWCLN